MARLDQDDALPRELPRRRHQLDGQRRQPDRQGPDRAGHHARRPPEEDHEQRTEHQGADTRQRLRGVFSVEYKKEEKNTTTDGVVFEFWDRCESTG